MVVPFRCAGTHRLRGHRLQPLRNGTSPTCCWWESQEIGKGRKTIQKAGNWRLCVTMTLQKESEASSHEQYFHLFLHNGHASFTCCPSLWRYNTFGLWRWIIRFFVLGSFSIQVKMASHVFLKTCFSILRTGTAEVSPWWGGGQDSARQVRSGWPWSFPACETVLAGCPWRNWQTRCTSSHAPS